MIAKRLGAALAGRGIWLRLKRAYDVDDGVYVLLMPEDDRELNEQALRHMDDLVAYRKARGVVILTDERWILDGAASYSDNVLAVERMGAKEMDDLLSFYELYAFTEQLSVVSLTKPHGRKLGNMLGVHGVTKEDLVCLGIFLIRNWTSAKGEDGQSRKGNT